MVSHAKFVGIVLFAAVAGHAQLPPGEGKQIVESVCSSCHQLNVVTNKKLSEPEWRNVVFSMIDRGATLSKEETAAAAGYLAKNFGKYDRAKELVEDICSSCHELRRIRSQQLSREQWLDLIKGMLSEGAAVTDQETAMIVDYLATNFGKNIGRRD